MKATKIWIIVKDGIPFTQAPVSLKQACSMAGVSYRTAAETGKRVWVRGESVIRLYHTEVIRMKARGNGLKNFK